MALLRKKIGLCYLYKKEILYFMKRILKLGEIEQLKNKGSIGEELSQYLIEGFLNMLQKIDTKIPVYEFDLTKYGKIVVFELKDNLSNLTKTNFDIKTVKKVLMNVFDEKLYYTGEILCKDGKTVHFAAPRVVYEKNIEYWFRSCCA